MKTLLRVIVIIFFTAVLIELLYFSLRETIKDYFYQTDEKIAQKHTAVDSEQSQIIVGLANQQQKMQSAQDQLNKLEKKSHTNQRTQQPSNNMLQQADIKAAPLDNIMLTDSKQNELLHKNNHVVVDCDKGAVLACPVNPVIIGTSPMFYAEGSKDFLVGRCANVSINVTSFCP